MYRVESGGGQIDARTRNEHLQSLLSKHCTIEQVDKQTRKYVLICHELVPAFTSCHCMRNPEVQHLGYHLEQRDIAGILQELEVVMIQR